VTNGIMDRNGKSGKKRENGIDNGKKMEKVERNGGR